MKIIKYIFTILIVLFSVTTVTAATKVTPLGLTQEEITVWNQRRVNGPYKSDGDVSSHSPGDWDGIVASATEFASNPLVDNWDGNTNNFAWQFDTACTGQNNRPGAEGCFPWHNIGHKILRAAFATLVDPVNHNYASHVRTALLNQIARPGTDFTNTTKWSTSFIGDGNSWAIANYLSRLAIAYSYVRSNSVFSAGERLSIDTWFSNTGYYWTRNSSLVFCDVGVFCGARSNFSTTVDIGGKYDDSSLIPNGPGGGNPAYYNCPLNQPGPFGSDTHEIWNNRAATQNRLGAITSHLNGTLPNDAQVKTWVKMFFKEWLTYAVFPDFTFNEYRRYEPHAPAAAYGYSAHAIGIFSTIADIFARNGDTSLYDFTTSSGFVWGASNPPGQNADTQAGVLGPKSLLKVIQRHASLVNQVATGSPGWYSYPTNAQCGNPDFLFAPIDALTGEEKIGETYYVQANLYYRDSNVKSSYMRTIPGSPAYPEFPASGADFPYEWTGEYYIYPGVLFMHGQMEDNVANPFFVSQPGSGKLQLQIFRRFQ